MVAAGVPRHITQSGNNRQDVFLLDDDRRFYVEALRAKSEQHGLTVLGYCLISNHVQLVTSPGALDPVVALSGDGVARWRAPPGGQRRPPGRRSADALCQVLFRPAFAR